MPKKGWVVQKSSSAMALPGEPIYGWIKWDKELAPRRITFKYDSCLEIVKLPNSDTDGISLPQANGEITLYQKRLEIPGFFGFIASYKGLPEREKTIDFAAEFDFGSESETLKSSTRIVRPVLEFEQPEYVINADSSGTILGQ